MTPLPGENTHQLTYHPDFERDLQALYLSSTRNKDPHASRLLAETLRILKSMARGRFSTHELEYLEGYPDLSDCQTTYVGIDDDQKPTHRIVWRELPPKTPGALPRREMIALGERNLGAAYHVAGARLGRPVGMTLDELSAMPEPIASPRKMDRPQQVVRRPQIKHEPRPNERRGNDARSSAVADRRRKYPELFRDDEAREDPEHSDQFTR